MTREGFKVIPRRQIITKIGFQALYYMMKTHHLKGIKYTGLHMKRRP